MNNAMQGAKNSLDDMMNSRNPNYNQQNKNPYAEVFDPRSN